VASSIGTQWRLNQMEWMMLRRNTIQWRMRRALHGPPPGREAGREMQPDATKRDPDPVQAKRSHRAVP